MPSPKPDFNTVFIATAAFIGGPNGLAKDGLPDQGRFIAIFDALARYYKILNDAYGQTNN